MKKLIISPHIDDEVLGCGGIIDKNTFIFECGVDDNRDVPGFGQTTKDSRLDELDEVCKLSGAQYTWRDHLVNKYEVKYLINDITDIINTHKPDEIYIPHPSYNQDHQAVYKASLIALRPHDVNHFVRKIFVSEQPQTFLWDWTDNDFKPNYFIEIDIEYKLKLYNLIPSQIRSYREPEMLRSMAYLRGKQCGYKYAEAYQILRWVE